MFKKMEHHRHLLSSSISTTPSFTTFSSSETLSQIAARVIHELTAEWEEPLNDNLNVNNDDHDDFEFPFVSGNNNSSLVSADDIFSNGQIRPMYPLFNDVVSVPETHITPRRRLPLRDLMFEEERGESCSSSSEERNLFNEPMEGSYCVWTPPTKNKKKKKKNSIDSSSSKRWKLRDLLLRSHSDRNEESLLFVGPSNNTSSMVRNGDDAISTLH